MFYRLRAVNYGPGHFIAKFLDEEQGRTWRYDGAVPQEDNEGGKLSITNTPTFEYGGFKAQLLWYELAFATLTTNSNISSTTTTTTSSTTTTTTTTTNVTTTSTSTMTSTTTAATSTNNDIFQRTSLFTHTLESITTPQHIPTPIKTIYEGTDVEDEIMLAIAMLPVEANDPLTEQKNQLIYYANSYNKQVEEVQNDGNCLYEAISKQLLHLGVQTTAYSIRCHMVNEVMDNQDLYEIGIQAYYQDVVEWYQKNSKLGDWGDETAIVALQRALNINIVIISSNGPDFNMQYPEVLNNNINTIWLGHRFEQHYVSLINKDQSHKSTTLSNNGINRVRQRKGDG
jgi:hypothetical protein